MDSKRVLATLFLALVAGSALAKGPAGAKSAAAVDEPAAAPLPAEAPPLPEAPQLPPPPAVGGVPVAAGPHPAAAPPAGTPANTKAAPAKPLPVGDASDYAVEGSDACIDSGSDAANTAAWVRHTRCNTQYRMPVGPAPPAAAHH
ncbi:MAG: hypothetical protein J3K34DRAFT_43587 [Monoraphidium minutum]|nr:MAG: hypothetical protein J3K34DRAFT_43587 [Monoraphidium minutum]